MSGHAARLLTEGNIMIPHITALYAAPLALMMTALSVHVTMLRAKTKISLLDGGNHQLTERIRRHGNFVENVPMVLLLMLIAEMLGASGSWLHAVGGILSAGRLIHMFGISYDKADAMPRIIGGGMTTLATLLAAGNILARVLAG
jgi:uncharacterized protein